MGNLLEVGRELNAFCKISADFIAASVQNLFPSLNKTKLLLHIRWI